MRRSIGLAMALSLAVLSVGAQGKTQGGAADSIRRLEEAARGALEELSLAYREAYPNATMRRAVAVLDFEAPGGGAEAASMAETASTYVEAELTRSTVFYAVDRKHVDEMLSEMELSLSGLFDGEGAPTPGLLRSAGALIVGKVSEAGDEYHVGLRLIDVETGAVIAAAAFAVARGDLGAASTELQYAYVAANGIGIAIGGGAMPQNPASMNQAVSFIVEAGLTYRPSRSWMYSLSLSSRPPLGRDEAYDYLYDPGDGGPLYSDYQPGGNFTPDGDADSIELYMERGYAESGPAVHSVYDYALLGLNAQYTMNLSPRFNVGLSGGPLFHLYRPRMALEYGTGELGGVFYRERYWDADLAAYDYRPAIDTKPLAYTFASYGIAGARVEIRPEVFVTPRLALALRVGYLYTIPLGVADVLASKADWPFESAAGVDAASWEPADYATTTADTFDVAIFQSEQQASLQYASWKYYGLNPLVGPEGARWIFDVSHAYACLTATVYF